MKSNLVVVFLIAVILALLVPLATGWYSTEKAFTPGNLITLHTVSNIPLP